MQTMERLGGYISRGMYTVSGSFHPFGGAVDIVVVEQPDGSFKSSPWYVRFGKFQGVLKAKEKVVQISVNGVDADFHMYLDHRGEACFLREVDAEDGESIASSSSSSSDETDDVNKGPLKSISCNFSSDKSNSAAQVDIISKGNRPLARTNSRRSRILRFVLGRKSMKGDNNDTNNDIYGKVDDPGIERRDSLERAEIAASLLDIKWSTSLAGTKPTRKNSVKTQESSSMENGLHQHKLNEEEDISSKSTIIDVAEDIEELETHIEKQVTGEEVFSVSPDDVPVYCKTSESSAEAVDYSGEETHAVLYLAGGGCQEVHVHADILHATTVLLPEVVKTEEVTKNTDQGMPVKDVSEFIVSDSNYSMEDGTEPPTLQDPQIVNLDQGLCSFNTTSSYGSLDNRVLEENSKDNDVSSILSLPPGSVGHCFLDETMSKPPSANLEEEHFLFRDLGECKSTYQCEESVSCGYVDKEDHPSSVDSIEKVDADYNSHSSPESSITENKKVDIKRLIPTRSPINVPRSKVAKGEVEMQIRSLPNISSHNNSLDKDEVRYPLSQSLVSKSKSLNYTLPGKDYLKRLQSDGDKENQSLHEDPDDKHNHSSGEFKSTALNPHIGDPSRLNPSGGNWGVWPFSFRRSRSAMATQTALIDAKITTSGDASESTMSTDADNNELKPNPTRKKVRVKTPTSEQLASLNLKEGRNIVTFTFATAMLGKQQVDAHIYLWKWNTRIVISDVDGTITRSDVLGQFMPLVGVDWSQTGVTHLFSAIRENGYHMLFLSARSISQAYHTRQFLFNLKQNGKVLPDGPVLISPDGLFPSLYREVIRRAPHEFKIACLEDIRALFPSDYNPFYAGFGNRDTDEISYFKVGIPKGKVFIINPKGEVAVNRRLDTKSYTSLHALVHGMFPPMKSSEQEDFNTWNFWKLPPPAIDI